MSLGGRHCCWPSSSHPGMPQIPEPEGWREDAQGKD